MNLIIASGPVIIEDNKILVSQHGDTPFWKFCGGQTKPEDKDLIGAAKRRAKEELGIDIETTNQEPFLMHIQKEIKNVLFDVILVHYLAKRIGEVKPGEDIREWAWLDINNLPIDDLGPNIIPALKHFSLLKQ